MFVAIAIGVLCGTLIGYVVARALVLRLAVIARNPRLVRIAGTVGGFVSLVPSFFLSFVVGGNFGGAGGEVVSEALGLGAIGVPVGLALGVAAVLASGVVLGSLLGGFVGIAAERARTYGQEP